MAKQRGEDVTKVAEDIAGKIKSDKLSSVSVANGFINFTFKPKVVQKSVLNETKKDLGKGEKVNIEFVSANPTGPLPLGNGRSASYGDALANILSFSGYDVTKEYFVNDIGNQIETLGESVARRYLEMDGKEIDFPENMYQGEYISEIAKEMKAEDIYKDSLDNFDSLKDTAKIYARDKMLGKIKDTLHRFGLKHDVWFSEATLKEGIDEVLKELESKGLTYESEGALWFKGTQFGLDKDVVIRKSIGDKPTTYVLSDFAYARNKFERGFKRNIYLLGADHHGDVARIQAGISALGLPQEAFNFLVYQLVTLKQGGEAIRMSKRKGHFVTLDELMDEIPVDVIRLFFLMKSLDKHMEFDLDLAKEQSNKNPVYYIQYAHARTKSLVGVVEEKGLAAEEGSIENLKEKEAVEVMALMARFSEVIEDVSKNLQVHQLVTYAYEMASAIHHFYDTHRVMTSKDDKFEFAENGESNMRLLVAGGNLLGKILNLLGVSAPEKM